MRVKPWVVVAVVIGVLLLWGFASYNSLVGAEETVNSQWSQIDNNLQRRADLIPNLVSTVKGYAAHEEEIFKAVSDARARLAGARNPAEAAGANDSLSSALSRLLMVVENYPNLKADANFRHLQDELAGTENRIATARRDYNEAVRKLNSKLRRFPTTLVAGMSGFEQREYFEAAEGAKDVPQVEF